jgi:hypothetical protein
MINYSDTLSYSINLNKQSFETIKLLFFAVYTHEKCLLATILALFQLTPKTVIFYSNLLCFSSKSFFILCGSAFCASKQHIIFSSCCLFMFLFSFLECALALANYGERAALRPLSATHTNLETE